MSVQIIINGENAQESLLELSALAAGLNQSLQGDAAVSTAKQEPAQNAQKRQGKSAKATTKSAEEHPTKDETEQNETGVDEAVNAAMEEEFSDEPVPTDVELRAAATEKAKTAGKVKVKALLDKYKVPNVTALPDDQRAAFLRELEELS